MDKEVVAGMYWWQLGSVLMGSKIADGVALVIMAVMVSPGGSGVRHIAILFSLWKTIRFFLLQWTTENAECFPEKVFWQKKENNKNKIK